MLYPKNFLGEASNSLPFGLAKRPASFSRSKHPYAIFIQRSQRYLSKLHGTPIKDYRQERYRIWNSRANKKKLLKKIVGIVVSLPYHHLREQQGHGRDRQVTLGYQSGYYTTNTKITI